MSKIIVTLNEKKFQSTKKSFSNLKNANLTSVDQYQIPTLHFVRHHQTSKNVSTMKRFCSVGGKYGFEIWGFDL